MAGLRAVVVVLLAGLALAGGAESAVAGDGCVRVPEYKHILKHKVIRFSHTGGNYVHYKIRNRGERRLERMKGCERQAGLERRLEDMRKVTRHRRSRWRFHRKIDRVTPWGEWAIPGYIVGCETGYTYSYTIWNNQGSGASGAYQMMPGTWAGVGGRKYAAHAAYAPPWAQHLMARRLYLQRGTQPWSCA